MSSRILILSAGTPTSLVFLAASHSHLQKTPFLLPSLYKSGLSETPTLNKRHKSLFSKRPDVPCLFFLQLGNIFSSGGILTAWATALPPCSFFSGLPCSP